MKNAIILSVILACITACASVSSSTEEAKPPSALQNEPNGFREISWGAAVPENRSGFRYNGPISSPPEYWDPRKKFAETESYTRENDKLEFGGVVMDSLEYHFHQNQFVFAVFFFKDHLTHHQPSMQKLQNAPPLSKLFKKSRVNRALKKYFGKPTEEPFFLAKINSNGIKSDRVAYRGQNTDILTICDDFGDRCWLVFSSAKFDNRLRASMVLDQQYADRVRKEKEKRAEENRANAKPDF